MEQISIADDFFAITREFQTLNFSLDRIRDAVYISGIDLTRLGKVVHIAGTNGKGSTSFFIAQMLHRKGFKTALYTSPHIESITERIKLNLDDISEDLFKDTFKGLKETIVDLKLTFFEALTLIAFDIFSKFSPDFTILETGMGGRLDATNVIDVKLPVITSISQDHFLYLGRNIFRIADEKLAIIKDNPTVFVGKNPAFLLNYIKTKLTGKDIVYVQDEDETIFYPRPYSYNFALARRVVEFLTNSHIEDFEYKLPPCRMERIGRFILDGSHNPSGLLNTIQNFDADTVIFSCTRDRPFERMLSILKDRFKNIIVTEIPYNDRSIKTDEITDLPGVIKVASPEEAVNKSIYISGKSDIIIIGSLYLCGFLRKYLKGFCG